MQDLSNRPKPSLEAPPNGTPLSSWKEIAAYFGRDARTVQRWEKAEGLPVHRHLHTKLGSVYAYPAELDQWRKVRAIPASQPMEAVSTGPQDVQPVSDTRLSKHHPGFWWILSCLFIAISGAMWLGSTRNSAPAPLVPVPLTSYRGDELAGGFSPDATQIAFCWNGEQQDNFDIYVEVIGSRKRLRLTDHPAADYSPAWSPDGHSIAFLRAELGKPASVWLIAPAGGTERKLAELNTLAAPESRSLDWSPDGQWIVMSEPALPSEPASLFLLSVKTGEKRRLTTPVAGEEDVQPAFSPDGHTIAFARDVGRGVSELTLLFLATDFRVKDGPRLLNMEGFEKAGNIYPRWTEDGKEIVFASNRAGGEKLWRVSATGGAPTLLAGIGGGASLPVLSRNGLRLAYTQGFVETNFWELRLGSREGYRPARPERLISSTRLDQNPQISPDRRRLAFESDRSGFREIWVSDRDGSNPMPLTNFQTSITGSPHWAPDGQSIAFDSRVEGQPEIYVIPVGGSKPIRLTNHPAADVVPRWSADGRWIYFASNRSGQFQIWKMPAGGGEPVQITRQGGFGALESPDGTVLFYTKTRSDITEIWRVTQNGGEEGPLLESVVDRGFAVTRAGIYFLRTESRGRGNSIQFMSFATGETGLIANLERPVQYGLSISPDGDSLVYAQVDQRDHDLMLVDNFR